MDQPRGELPVVPEDAGGADPPSTRWPLVAGAAVALVLVLVLAVVLAVRRQGLDRGPFDDAIARLAAAPVVHQRSSLAGAEWEADVTAHEEAIGSFTLAGIRLDLLVVQGRSYARIAEGTFPMVDPGGHRCSSGGG